ncbi:MAG TPA: hypothetical protein VKE30_08255 [Chthoniobacterales bacterium]|nr:hypothetical protein [Chthoniobacterales bacterium]
MLAHRQSPCTQRPAIEFQTGDPKHEGENMRNAGQNPNSLQFIIVVIGGAIGGLLSFFWSLVSKDQLLSSVSMSIIVSVCLGAFIALVIIFLLRWVKPSGAVIYFVWAMVFGFLWKPAASALTSYGTQIINNRLAAATKESANNALAQSTQLQPTLPAATLKPKINDTVNSALETVKTLPEVKDPTARNEVAQKVATTASQLSEVAVKNGDASVAKQATEALNKLGETAVETKSYGIANAVSKSLEDVANSGQANREVRLQAWQLKQKIDAVNVPAAVSPR